FLEAAQASGQKATVIALLANNYESTQSLDVLAALVSAGWKGESEAYTAHLAQTQSLVAASHLMESSGGAVTEDAKNAVKRASEPLMRYRCAACGFESKQHFWQCPGCQVWDTYPFKRIEEI
ncbi:MAG: hypothetical protein RLY82_1220, partial [Pseudomonadota bacterium]